MSRPNFQVGVLVILALLSAACSEGGSSPSGNRPDALDFFGDLDCCVGVRDVGLDVPADATPPNIGDASADIGFFDGGPTDADEPVDGGIPAATVNLTFAGACAPDFGGDVVVAIGEGLTVSSLRMSQLQASLQYDLRSFWGAQVISTRNRLETGLKISLLTANTWTNASTDPQVIAGEAPDPVQGTLLIADYQPDSGISDLTFIDVVLQSPADDSLCTINGTITTARLGA